MTLCAATFYVDDINGSDARSGQFPSVPKKTIQAAIKSAAPDDIIYVAPGSYAPFEMTKRLTIIGAMGPGRTIIDGGGKKRCVKFADIEGYELHGFTLQNGYSGKEHGGGAYKGLLRNCIIRNCRTFDAGKQYGGGGTYLSRLYDCRIENCRAGFGGAMYGGEAFRCTFRQNYAWDRGGAMWGATAHHSLLHDNRCDNYGGLPGGAGAHGSYLYNCTVTRNRIGRNSYGAGGLHECWSYNCIVWDNHNPWHPEHHQYYEPKERPFDHYASDPHFIGPDRFDFHLRHDSPCRRIGKPEYLPHHDDPKFHDYHPFDRDRNPRFHGNDFDLGCFEEDERFNTITPNEDGSFEINYNPMGEQFVSVALDGTTLLSSSTNGVYQWQPQTLGWHTNVFTYGQTAVTGIVNVVKLPYWVQASPNAPMPVDDEVVISPVTKNVNPGGAGYSISTKGSTHDWEAVVSDSWIILNKDHDVAGNPVAYTVTLNTNAETRIGYIYVSGHVYTISQAGVGSTLDKTSALYESAGGTGKIELNIDSRHIWKARPNVDWISVDPTAGMSSGEITYTVAPYYDVTTRSGTITAGGNTFTVFQYGRRMGLEPYSITNDYYTHVFPITVNALDITAWDVKPNNSWLSVVSIVRNSKTGLGAGTVTIAMGENPSYVERTGTFTIGTETFRVTQAGRADVKFSLSPETTSASANGANGMIAIEATSDLPWTAESQANWLTIYTPYATGTGNGNVAYTVSPNTTVYAREGTITVTPDANSGLPAFIHKVMQPAANVAVSLSGYEFDAAGESMTVTVTAAKNVEWTVDGIDDVSWLGITGDKTVFVGTQTITLTASANDSVFTRDGAITIAGKLFAVTQKARGVEVDDYFKTTFDEEGGTDVINVYPDGNIEWTAVSSDPDWLTVADDGEVKSGENGVQFWVSEYNGDGTSRTATITIGSKVIYITQTPYSVSIEPSGAKMAGNAGAGEISVSASSADVWNAIATEPWITVVTSTGQGSGKVQFVITDNNTGKSRTGKILINDKEYTLVQTARQLVAVSGVVDGHGGTVANAGTFDLGSKILLTAVPDAGYRFSYWTLPDDSKSMENPIEVTADIAKSYTAKFLPMTPDITKIVSSADGVTLTWENLDWALSYKIYRGSSEVPSEAIVIDEIANDGSSTYFDETGDIGLIYFYWVEAVGQDDAEMSKDAMAGTHEKAIIISKITYANLKGALHENPETYQEEVGVVFQPPTTEVAGYVFNAWEPAQITTEDVGPKTVSAVWTANKYTVTYNPNGGSGTMTSLEMTYDEYLTIPQSTFAYAGHTFIGWATTANGAVVYQPGSAVRNLTATQNGVVMLYAVWQLNTYIVNGEEVAYGTQKTFTAPSPSVDKDGTTQIVCLGTSTYPESGSEFTLTVTDDIAFVWDTFETNYWLEVENETPKGGAVTTNGVPFVAGWVKADTDVVLTAAPNADYQFGSWYGEITGCEKSDRVLTVPMTLPRIVGVSFTYNPEISEVAAPVIAPADGTSFSADSQTVTITCATDGAQIYYTVNGLKPRVRSADLYSAPFMITETKTIKAMSIYERSDGVVLTNGIVTATITKVEASTAPSIPGDEGATMTGDANTGFTIKPSSGKKSVEVTIPSGIEPSKVTVEIGKDVTSVKPNGAKLKIMSGEHNITDYLDVPSADASGSIDLTKAAVKEEIVKEALDTTKGAVIEITADSPTLTTSETKLGLTYTFSEGTTLEGLTQKSSKVGDGKAWTPDVSVKGGTSGFYSIGVSK